MKSSKALVKTKIMKPKFDKNNVKLIK